MTNPIYDTGVICNDTKGMAIQKTSLINKYVYNIFAILLAIAQDTKLIY